MKIQKTPTVFEFDITDLSEDEYSTITGVFDMLHYASKEDLERVKDLLNAKNDLCVGRINDIANKLKSITE